MSLLSMHDYIFANRPTLAPLRRFNRLGGPAPFTHPFYCLPLRAAIPSPIPDSFDHSRWTCPTLPNSTSTLWKHSKAARNTCCCCFGMLDLLVKVVRYRGLVVIIHPGRSGFPCRLVRNRDIEPGVSRVEVPTTEGQGGGTIHN